MQLAAEAVMPNVVSVTAVPLKGGSSAHVAALLLESPVGEQRRVVFRQHSNDSFKEHANNVAAKEFRLTRWLADEGLAVARPLALHNSDVSDGPWLVSEWVEGTTYVAVEDVDAALVQMADYLARLHRVDPAALDAPGITDIEDPIESLPRYLVDDTTGHSVRRLLAAGVERRPNPTVLLHGDYWPGNVMFDNGQIVAVLDWEDATLGDPLVDLACARVELACAYGDESSERFSALYLASSPELDHYDLALWDVYVSATALSSMHHWGLAAADEAARRQTTTRFLEAAIDRIALSP